MKSKIIVMLTLNDVTADNAIEVFESCKDLPVTDWGFKNVGLSIEERSLLAKRMKESDKEIYIEDVLNSEKDTMEMAVFAQENGVKNIIGRYYQSVMDFTAKKGINYFACSTKSSGIPVMLRGPIQEIVDQLCDYSKKGADGVCVGAYRHESDPEGLIKMLGESVDKKIVIAGSIDSKERMKTVNDNNCYGFTMGSALFNGKFVPNGSFRDNLLEVLKLMDTI